MNPIHFQSAQPSPWFPMLPPEPPHSSAFWQKRNVRDRLQELQDTLNLAMAMQKELEMLMMIKEGKGSEEDARDGSTEPSVSGFLKCLEDRRVGVETQESLAVEAANALMSKLRAQLEPFRYIVDEASPWEEKSAAARLANKLHKSKRNKLWRKRKRKRIAKKLEKEREQFDQIDREADEWRAREIAKNIASRKMEKMKEIAKLKAKEEKKKLESELELLLMVEKLQELRSIRIQKLKKQVMQAIFSQRRTTSFWREFKLQLRKKSAKLWLQLIQMLPKMQLQRLRNPGKPFRIKETFLRIPATTIRKLRSAKSKILIVRIKRVLVQLMRRHLPKFYLKDRVMGEHTILWQIYQLNSITIIMVATLISVHLLRLEEDGMLISAQEEAVYQGIGFSLHLQLMKYGHPTW